MEANSDAFRINAQQWPNFTGYEPLNETRQEIRLLCLRRDTNAGLLQCTFQHRDLAERPDYYALSYYWGAPPRGKDELQPLLVNGEMVHVRQTTHAFLQQLHDRLNEPVIWLDVLCINQRDVGERNRQVAMMGDIFTLAVGVYSWLGDGNADTNLIFDHICGDTTEDQRTVISANLLRRCLDQVLGVPYWNRVWVIQEVVLARRVWLVCGSRICVWEPFMNAAAALYKEPDRFNAEPWAVSTNGRQMLWDNVYATVQYRTRYIRHKERESLLKLVRTFVTKECTEPRDRIFALRSLAEDGHMIKVDYAAPKLDLLFNCVAMWTLSRSLDLQSLTLENTRPITEHDDLLMIEDLFRSLQVSHSDISRSSLQPASGIMLAAKRLPTLTDLADFHRNVLGIVFNMDSPSLWVTDSEEDSEREEPIPSKRQRQSKPLSSRPPASSIRNSSGVSSFGDLRCFYFILHGLASDEWSLPISGISQKSRFLSRIPWLLPAWNTRWLRGGAFDYLPMGGLQMCARARRKYTEHEGGEALDLLDVEWIPVHVSRAMLLLFFIGGRYGVDKVPHLIFEHLQAAANTEGPEELCDCETQ